LAGSWVAICRSTRKLAGRARWRWPRSSPPRRAGTRLVASAGFPADRRSFARTEWRRWARSGHSGRGIARKRCPSGPQLQGLVSHNSELRNSGPAGTTAQFGRCSGPAFPERVIRVASACERWDRYRSQRPRRPSRTGGHARSDSPGQRIRLSGGSPRAVRWMFSAISVARASSMPSVQPETCGVISTLSSSWKGRRDGKVGPGSVG